VPLYVSNLWTLINMNRCHSEVRVEGLETTLTTYVTRSASRNKEMP